MVFKNACAIILGLERRDCRLLGTLVLATKEVHRPAFFSGPPLSGLYSTPSSSPGSKAVRVPLVSGTDSGLEQGYLKDGRVVTPPVPRSNCPVIPNLISQEYYL